jgi:hypothetical protein
MIFFDIFANPIIHLKIQQKCTMHAKGIMLYAPALGLR